MVNNQKVPSRPSHKFPRPYLPRTRLLASLVLNLNLYATAKLQVTVHQHGIQSLFAHLSGSRHRGGDWWKIPPVSEPMSWWDFSINAKTHR